MYKYFNLTEYVLKCVPCDMSCETCSGEGPKNCTKCRKGLLLKYSEITNSSSCESCKKGYYLGKEDRCKGNHLLNLEICGDGLNLGMYECDDGNTINGDGCNSECEVEDGFKCQPQKEGPDICKDIIPPTATLKISKGNVIMLTFNEKVSINMPGISLIIK